MLERKYILRAEENSGSRIGLDVGYLKEKGCAPEGEAGRDVESLSTMERDIVESPRRRGGNVEKLRVIIVGGSIAGLSCAHALLKSGVCRVMVLEKARALNSNSSGAGLGIDAAACEALEDWGLRDEFFLKSKPLDSEESRAIDPERKVYVTLARDENYRHWAAHWSEVHRILRDSLPEGIVHFNHEAISFEDMEDGRGIKVTVAEGGDTEVVKEVQGDFVVAADGSMSRTRHFYVPNEKRRYPEVDNYKPGTTPASFLATPRYSGYCAWRGVFDYTNRPKIADSIREIYPDIGHCLYFDIARGTHAVLYELPGRRLNWLWYVNQPEPDLKRNSVTIQPDEDAIAKMHEEADRTWVPALAKLIKATSQPFINAIFDRNPLERLVYERVVLVGEAAHPTTPHGLRSTNMSILDAHVLGKALAKWGPINLSFALAEYERMRLSVTSQQVLFSRHIGSLKQGLLFEPKGSFPWPTADDGMVEGLLQRNMNYFQWRC